ncbi:hypothetical protein CEUSTIGMA_g6909.t1 [Chlamydomonas eustigma]|uniref:Photolyase/cryptochrome alpha/beta domain-containing protein n=1 Tax=Chlamydomonas eustigma TaxID=1157962 RepID=A0A250X8Q9_9CHLO|nr:hypothetical protein CEUSTIGMA_g6909.t1 [Chlamydomonas eustigma]|eukprot:GAX79468.1 hypothetical protein CEUSTIGMA_g6909.t1 [Chlamydomonas eustigma]
MATNTILWFRKGLRIHDNPALLDACNNARHMYPVFIIDPHFLKSGSYRVGVNRYNFLLESLQDLDSRLRERGSRLLVMRGKPEDVLPKAFKDWDVKRLCYEVDTEPYAMARDEVVKSLASEACVDVNTFISHTLYDTAELVKKNGGRPPLTMQAFTKLVDKMGDPPYPATDPPAKLPPLSEDAPGTRPEDTCVPTWQEMGFKAPPSTLFKGGETEALKRFQMSMSDASWVAAFEKPMTDPSAFEKPATTVLSPYLKFGCLSARLFHAELLKVYKQKKHTEPPVSLRGQVLWREFFYTVGGHTPNFHKMEGNPICRQIDWQDNEEHFNAWREGRTGFPWIDAIMTQLREWGWMHHLARHSVACFLTRGDLYIPWEKGMQVFEEYLIDQDHFVNAGNWMWLSASAFFSQYFRVYSPVAFGKKYDPEGKYIRKFLPVLKDMPTKYIYEPWLAPLEVQRKAKCIVGQDYPRPIVDHAVASKACIARIGVAYRAGRPSYAGADDGETETASKPVKRKSGNVKEKKAAAGAATAEDEPAEAKKAKGAKRQKKITETLKPSSDSS